MRSAQFSEAELNVWHGALSGFPAWILNRAVLVIGATGERFPEFRDLYAACRAEARKAGILNESYVAAGSDHQQASGVEITAMGDALGLAVRPSKEGGGAK